MLSSRRPPSLGAQRVGPSEWDWDEEDEVWAQDWSSTSPESARPAHIAVRPQTALPLPTARPLARRTTVQFVGFAIVLATVLLYWQMGSITSSTVSAKQLAPQGEAPQPTGTASVTGRTINPAGASPRAAMDARTPLRTPGTVLAGRPPALAPHGDLASELDRQCHEWSLGGECVRNPSYMLAHCTRACQRLGVGAGAAPSPAIKPSPATRAGLAEQSMGDNGKQVHVHHLDKAAAQAEALAIALANHDENNAGEASTTREEPEADTAQENSTSQGIAESGLDVEAELTYEDADSLVTSASASRKPDPSLVGGAPSGGDNLADEESENSANDATTAADDLQTDSVTVSEDSRASKEITLSDAGDADADGKYGAVLEKADLDDVNGSDAEDGNDAYNDHIDAAEDDKGQGSADLDNGDGPGEDDSPSVVDRVGIKEGEGETVPGDDSSVDRNRPAKAEPSYGDVEGADDPRGATDGRDTQSDHEEEKRQDKEDVGPSSANHVPVSTVSENHLSLDQARTQEENSASDGRDAHLLKEIRVANTSFSIGSKLSAERTVGDAPRHQMGSQAAPFQSSGSSGSAAQGQKVPAELSPSNMSATMAAVPLTPSVVESLASASITNNTGSEPASVTHQHRGSNEAGHTHAVPGTANAVGTGTVGGGGSSQGKGRFITIAENSVSQDSASNSSTVEPISNQSVPSLQSTEVLVSSRARERDGLASSASPYLGINTPVVNSSSSRPLHLILDERPPIIPGQKHQEVDVPRDAPSSGEGSSSTTRAGEVTGLRYVSLPRADAVGASAESEREPVVSTKSFGSDDQSKLVPLAEVQFSKAIGSGAKIEAIGEANIVAKEGVGRREPIAPSRVESPAILIGSNSSATLNRPLDTNVMDLKTGETAADVLAHLVSSVRTASHGAMRTDSPADVTGNASTSSNTTFESIDGLAEGIEAGTMDPAEDNSGLFERPKMELKLSTSRPLTNRSLPFVPSMVAVEDRSSIAAMTTIVEKPVSPSAGSTGPAGSTAIRLQPSAIAIEGVQAVPTFSRLDQDTTTSTTSSALPSGNTSAPADSLPITTEKINAPQNWVTPLSPDAGSTGLIPAGGSATDMATSQLNVMTSPVDSSVFMELPQADTAMIPIIAPISLQSHMSDASSVGGPLVLAPMEPVGVTHLEQSPSSTASADIPLWTKQTENGRDPSQPWDRHSAEFSAFEHPSSRSHAVDESNSTEVAALESVSMSSLSLTTQGSGAPIPRTSAVGGGGMPSVDVSLSMGANAPGSSKTAATEASHKHTNQKSHHGAQPPTPITRGGELSTPSSQMVGSVAPLVE